mgnify:FL=1
MRRDNDLAVARTAGLALARTGAAGIPDIIASTLANDDSGDRFFQDGLARALEMLGKKGVDTLRSLAESGDKKQTDLAADVFLGLRSREAAKLIPRLLVNPHVDEKERARLVRSYTNYLLTPPVSLDPLIEYLEKKTDEKPSVKLATLQLLAFADDAKS